MSRRPAEAMGLVLAVLAALVFTGLAVVRHHNFHSHAFDLAYYTQVVWNTAQGDWWRVTYLMNMESGFVHHLGGHVELILLLFAAVYHILPRPEVLLVAQSLGFALGGWAIWALGRRWGLGVVAAAAGQALYYLHPSIQGPALFDFHPLVLASPLLLAGLLAAEHRKPRLFLLSALLALACREQVALYVVALAAAAAWRTRWWRLCGAVAAVALLWFVVCLGWIIPGYHPTGRGEHFAVKFGHLGETPRQAAVAVVRHPLRTAGLLLDAERRRYLGALAAYSGGPLALAAPWALAPALPELAVNLLSRVHDQRVHQYQYAATIASFSIVASLAGVAGLCRVLRRGRRAGWAAPIGAMLLLGAVAVSLWMHRRQYGTLYPLERNLIGTYRSEPRDATARDMLRRIPADAIVCAQSDLAPHLAHRRTAYVFPFVNDADYVLLDRHGETFPLTKEAWAQWFARWSADPRLELVEERDGFILLGRKGRPA